MKTRIYTDGSYSKEQNVGGYAIIITGVLRNKSYHGVIKSNSNNNIELKAVVKALTIANRLKLKDIEIMTDSAYVVNSINKGSYIEWKDKKWITKNGIEIKNKNEWNDLINIISELKKNGSNVSITKVKAHSNNYFNEKADSLARIELKKYLERKGK